MRMLANIRAGRMQKLFSALTAGSVPALAFEIYTEHYKGSFGDKWMWTPIALTPPLTAAGIGGVFSERIARTWLPGLSALYALDGLVGIWTHLRGVQKRPGGLREPTYNIVMGPPLLAPGSLCLVGALGILAGLVERER
jgi:hypothetical protein